MRTLLLTASLLFLPLTAFGQDTETMRLDLGQPAAQETAPPVATEQTVQQVPETVAPAQDPNAIQPAAPAQFETAQATQPAGSAEDRDHMIACAIVYQRISDMYQERGETENATAFVRTAYAYSQTADILYTQEVGAESAYDIITQRMTMVSDSLNRESQALPNGDLGVIENWLGWCDERGEFVQNTIDAFTQQQQQATPPAQP